MSPKLAKQGKSKLEARKEVENAFIFRNEIKSDITKIRHCD